MQATQEMFDFLRLLRRVQDIEQFRLGPEPGIRREGGNLKPQEVQCLVERDDDRHLRT
jgi:hypothetical protein